MKPTQLLIVTMALVLMGAGAASVTEQKTEKDPDGISTAALSRCAGIAGLEIREADAAFGGLTLDGVPWLSARQEPHAMMVSGTGTLRRRNGTTVPFRFLCMLDQAGRATRFQTLPATAGDPLPPARPLRGIAVPAGLKAPLARGAELRVQLLDIAKDPAGEILAEQVVRSGWEVPIHFALRVPMEMPLDGRQLAIGARIVLARSVIYRMERPRPLKPEELQGTIVLDLSP